MESPNVSEYTGYLIRRAQQAHVAAWQSKVSAEFSSVQFGVLNVIQHAPGASQQVLCSELDLDRSTIADIVARLERRGLIARSRDALDRRRNVLTLTPAGRSQLAKMIPRVAEVDTVLTGALDEDERVALRRILSRLLETQPERGLAPGQTPPAEPGPATGLGSAGEGRVS